MNNDPTSENDAPEGPVDLGGLDLGGLDLSPGWAREAAGVASNVKPSRARGGDRPLRRDSGRRTQGAGKSRPRAGGSRWRGEPHRREEDQRDTDRPVLIKGIRVTFVPDRQALNTVIKLMKHNRVAYSLQELAVLFMSKPEASMARFEVMAETGLDLYQVQADRSVFVSREAAQQAALAHHLAADFDCEEVDGDVPKGEFKCVGRCRKSGVLLGPPNYHSYSQAVTALWAERFSNLSLDEFKKGIELVHDEEVIEAWKEQASKCWVYRPRISMKNTGVQEGEGEESASALSAQEVEQNFIDHRIKKALKRTAKASVPHASLSRSEGPLQDLARVVRGREIRRPSSIQFALRPALKNSGIHFFKVAGTLYAGAIAPKPVPDEALAPELIRWMRYIREHPGAKRQDVLVACGAEEEESAGSLRLLIEQGHVILLSDQTLQCA